MREELRNTARSSRFASHRSSIVLRVCSLLFVISGSPHLTKSTISINNLHAALGAEQLFSHVRPKVDRLETFEGEQQSATENTLQYAKINGTICERACTEFQIVISACSAIKGIICITISVKIIPYHWSIALS